MNNIFGFDVDGVLCNRSEPIDNDFKLWFQDWSKDKTYYIVTGSGRDKAISQIGEEILLGADISFHCLGNNIWIKDHEVTVNQIILKKEEIDFLENCIKQSTFPIKTGNHIEVRKGSVNFSIIGRNASKEERLQYIHHDKQHQERIKIIKKFMYEFPRFDAYIGGDVSIDICLAGANKGQIFNLLNLSDKTFHYFGDRCFVYGVDFPVANELQKTNHICHQIDNGFMQTYTILKSI